MHRMGCYGELAAGPEVQDGSFRSGKCEAIRSVPRARSRARISLFVMSRVALLGGGKMGAALLGGLLDGGFDPDSLTVAEIDVERRKEIEARFPKVRVVPSGAWGVADADVVIVAVKPGDVAASLAAALPALPERALVLSIAAGVTIATLEAAAPGRPVVRAMPNTPALVGLGASAIAPGAVATDEHLDVAERLLRSVGVVVRVDEPQLDAVTGLSGSGPAYVMLVAEALTEAGVLTGLPRVIAIQLVQQTLLGSATLLANSDEGPESLRAAVTSPGGTTAAGLRALEARGVRAAFIDAVVAATERSRELGRKG
jgi:pyrroline-5-carboxylate reductase